MAAGLSARESQLTIRAFEGLAVAAATGQMSFGQLSQEAFHLLDGQNRNKIFDVCPFLKLVCSVAQHPFNLGYWARELFT